MSIDFPLNPTILQMRKLRLKTISNLLRVIQPEGSGAQILAQHRYRVSWGGGGGDVTFLSKLQA